MLLVIHSIPIVDAGPDRVLIAGQSLTLHATVEGESPVYSWSPTHFLSDPSSLEPIAGPPADISYLLQATSAFGCTGEDAVSLKVVSGIFIPTAFTPNNDHLNDQWRIPYLDPLWQPEATIYNRYGQPVYQAKGTDISWDGRLNGALQPTGVYVYIVRLSSLGLVYKGTLTLVR
jgi:gliding motility-associated-like protein